MWGRPNLNDNWHFLAVITVSRGKKSLVDVDTGNAHYFVFPGDKIAPIGALYKQIAVGTVKAFYPL